MSDELRLESALRSPALALDPPPDLLTGVVRRARRTRRRQTAGAAVVALAVSGTAVGLAGVLGGHGADSDGVAQQPPVTARLFPDATSPVLTLARPRGGTVYTWFQRGSWCTASVRTGPANVACDGSIGAARVRPFAYLRGPELPSLRVDEAGLVAGVLGDGVREVRVRLAGGGTELASVAVAPGFRRPVWYLPVTPGQRVVGYVAYAPDGAVVQRRGA